jgi:hypothetical protein
MASAESTPPGNETLRLVISILGSLALALFIGLVVSQWQSLEIPIPLNIGMLMILPTSAYLFTSLLSLAYQQITFGDVKPFVVLFQNLAVFALNLIVAFVLWFESVPVFKYIFGLYEPRNPNTGVELVKGTSEYQDALANENHYKLSFFSGIVKAVLSNYFDEPMKEGCVYAYWSFWATLLPWYAVLFLLGNN